MIRIPKHKGEERLKINRKRQARMEIAFKIVDPDNDADDDDD